MLAAAGKRNALLAAYGYAFSLAVAAAVPGLNFVYSGHGGPAWLLLPFALPIAIAVLAVGYFKASGSERMARGRFALASLAAYVPFSLLASCIGSISIHATFGLTVGPLQMWALFMSPFGLPFVW